ncbi:PAS domain S-box protein, partial [candidate division KSB1 bacterium]
SDTEKRLIELEKENRQLSDKIDHIDAQNKKLMHNEEQLRLTLKSAPIGIVTTLPGGKFRSVNAKFCDIIGYSEEELLKMSVRDVTHPDFIQQDIENLGKLWRNEIKEFSSEKKYIRKNKEEITGIITVSLVYVDQNKPLFTVGQLEDITHRLELESSLKKNMQTMDLMINSAPDIIYRLDAVGNIVFINKAIEKLGYSTGELTGNSILEIVHPDDREQAQYRINERRTGDRSTKRFELRLVRKDQNIVPFEEKSIGFSESVFLVDAEGFYDNIGQEGMAFSGTLGIARDITERVKVLNALKKSEEKYRTLFETMTQGVVYQNADEYITSANPAAERILGLSLDQMQGKSSMDPDWKSIYLDGTDFPGELHPAMIALKTGREVKNVIMGVYHPKEKKHVWININAVPQFRPDEEKPYKVHATFEDMTERKNAEEALYRTRFSIDKAVDSIFWITKDGRFFDVNEAACSELGYSKDELLNMYVKDIVQADPHDYQKRTWQERWKLISEKGYANFETWHKRKDGTTIPVEINASLSSFGGEEYIVAFSRNLSNRQKADKIQEVLYKILDATLKTSTLEELLSAIHVQMNKLMDATNFYVALYDPENKTCTFPFAVDEYDEIPPFPMKIEGGLTEYILKTREPRLFNRELMLEMEESGEIDIIGKKPESWLGVPLLEEGEAVGVVAVQSYRDPKAYSESDLVILSYVSGHIALAIEKKKAESDLYDSRQKMALHVEKTPLGVIEWDLNFCVAAWNKSAEDMFGYTFEEAFGKHANELIMPEEIHNLADKIWQGLLAQKGGTRSNNEILTKDRKRIHCEWYNTPLINEQGEVIGVTSLVLDITERVIAEKELRFSRFSLDQSADAAYWITPEAKFIYVNNASCESLGYTQEELINLTVYDVDPNFTKEIWPAHWRDIKEKGPFSLESLHRRKDGTTFPVEITVNYLAYEDKEFNCAFVKDISDKKRIEKEKVQLQEQLFQSQKMESIGRLAGGIAHDFNNILTGIMGYSELLHMRFPDIDSTEGKAAYVILRSTERAAQLTRQLLGFARAGKYDPNPVSINRILEDTVRVLEKIFEKKIDVHLQLEKNLSVVVADSNQLGQVFTNILINAKDAMPNGGELSIISENSTVEKTSALPELKPGKYVKVQVKDTGTGIPDNLIKSIFEPFFTTKKEGQGTGLGLASAYGIVKNHDGYIYCDSEVGKGTVITIYLHSSKKTVEKRKEKKVIKSGKATILLVDDEEDIRELGITLLEKLGYTILTANDGKEALSLYKKNQREIDLVILDMIMPNKGGKETFEAILSAG